MVRAASSVGRTRGCQCAFIEVGISNFGPAAGRFALFKTTDVSRHKSVDTLGGYAPDAEPFRALPQISTCFRLVV